MSHRLLHLCDDSGSLAKRSARSSYIVYRSSYTVLCHEYVKPIAITHRAAQDQRLRLPPAPGTAAGLALAAGAVFSASTSFSMAPLSSGIGTLTRHCSTLPAAFSGVFIGSTAAGSTLAAAARAPGARLHARDACSRVRIRVDANPTRIIEAYNKGTVGLHD